MTDLWSNDSLTFPIMTHSHNNNLYTKMVHHEGEKYSRSKLNSILKWTTFVNEVFDSMISLKSNQMNALWPNDSLTFTFYEAFSNSIQKWMSFVKEFFDSR